MTENDLKRELRRELQDTQTELEKLRSQQAPPQPAAEEDNEDSFLCNNEMALYAVADGMGGHLGGERASRMAVEILEREIADVRKAGLFAVRAADGPAGAPNPIAALLRKAVVEADRHIYEAALANPELAGMGTTLTALLFHGG